MRLSWSTVVALSGAMLAMEGCGGAAPKEVRGAAPQVSKEASEPLGAHDSIRALCDKLLAGNDRCDDTTARCEEESVFPETVKDGSLLLVRTEGGCQREGEGHTYLATLRSRGSEKGYRALALLGSVRTDGGRGGLIEATKAESFGRVIVVEHRMESTQMTACSDVLRAERYVTFCGLVSGDHRCRTLTIERRAPKEEILGEGEDCRPPDGPDVNAPKIDEGEGPPFSAGVQYREDGLTWTLEEGTPPEDMAAEGTHSWEVLLRGGRPALDP